MIRPVAADGRIETGGAFTPIHRPRVVERIESAATQPIVLIIAPAGYGKSVALRQYLDGIQGDQVRYDLHEENASLLGFVRGFAEAFIGAAPDARKAVSGAYDKCSASKTPGLDLAMWMHAHIKTFTGIIALDDLHIAENDPEISRFLVSLIERTKGRVKWLIASRSTLDLPVGSWLAYGEMDLTIDEQDLRFTLDEARSTARGSRVSVRDEELHEILGLTEGWPTALSFALRSSTRSVDLRSVVANTREMVYRFLAEQVYESLNLDERELLHFVGYLHEIDLDVLRCAGYATAKALIERLRDRVAFIYPERPNVYRCHDLFRQFLQHQLELQGDAVVNAMRLRVADALEGTNKIAQALEAYAYTGAETHVVRLLESYGFALTEQAHGDAVNLALGMVSDEARAVNPFILALRGMREADAGRIDRAQSLLERAIQKASDARVAGDLSTRLATLMFNHGRDVVSLLEPLLALDIGEKAHVLCLSLLAPAYAHAGRREAAERCFEEARRWAAEVDADDLRARLLHRMGIAALSLAFPLDEVASYFSRAHAISSEAGLYVTSTAALTGLATVYQLYEDDSAKAVWYSQQAVTAASKAGDRYSMQNALLRLINAEAKRGNGERLASLEQQFASVAGSDSSRALYVVASRAMAQAWRGEFTEAQRLMASIAEKPLLSFDRILNGALHAVYMFAAGMQERALGQCEKVAELIEAEQFELLHAKHQVEIARLLCAVIQSLSGKVTAANRILHRTPIIEDATTSAMRDVALAVQRAVKRPALAADIEEPLSMLQTLGYGGIAKVLESVLPSALQAGPAETSELTKTELSVLRALGEGRSPKEIAEESGRSIYTVQTHVQNAIRKLGCSGRNEALSVARKRGLIA